MTFLVTFLFYVYYWVLLEFQKRAQMQYWNLNKTPISRIFAKKIRFYSGSDNIAKKTKMT